MIEETNPEGIDGIMKVISTEGEGLRAKMIAISKNKKEAIALLLNAPLVGFEKWGMLVLVKEKKSDEWPVVVKQVNAIPNTKKWSVTLFDSRIAELKKRIQTEEKRI